MRTKFSGILTLLLAFVVQFSFAQQQTISGTVTDNTGLPLPGVNILIQGSESGTQSDFNGNYSLQASVGQVIVFSYVGFTTQSITVTPSTATVNITMTEDVDVLGEVIVTALGIRKEKKAIGYAVTNLTAGDIEDRATGDITRILQGKAAGVNVINASGLSGSGTSVNIRGITSTGNNQPLYVVDGIRFNSSTSGTGFSGSSRFMDLDPNNIESINVLKGLSASALYGADGKNGVIVITTKAATSTGSAKKTEISVNFSTFFNELASLPDYTNQRGQGYYDAYYNFFGNWGATFGRWDYGNVDSQGQIRHPYGLNSAVFNNAFPDESFARVDYRNYKSQENFFRTGIVSNNNVNVKGGSENSSYNIFIGNLEDKGFLPGNTFRRTTLSVGGTANLSNNFSVNSTLNYAGSSFGSPFTGGIFDALYNTPRSINLGGWPSQHPVTGEEISFQTTSRNPYWLLDNTSIRENVLRVYGQLSGTYTFNDNFSAIYRYGIDNSVITRKLQENKGNIFGDLGVLQSSTRRQMLTNHTMMLNYEDRFFDYAFGISANIGADIAQTKETLYITTSTDQTIFGLNEHNFFKEHDAVSGEYTLNRPGVFAQFTFDYENFLFLTASGRNEWTSNFNNNSQFYPGVGLSFLPTEAISTLKGDGLNYLKLRASYGSSADFNVPGSSLFGLFNPYPTDQVLGINSNAFNSTSLGLISSNTISNQLSNTNIKPALIEEFEYGIESRLWKNRISLDVSYFSRTTSDLIFARNLDPSTGYTVYPTNVNEFKVQGVEVEFNVKVVDSEKFRWSVGGNFTKTDSEVTELEEERFSVASFGNVGNYLIEGEPINVIMGTVIATDEDGNFLTNGRDYVIDPEIKILGDPNPDFITSFFTSIDYKNFSLTANMQYRHGGVFYSQTARSLLGRGLTSDTDNIHNVGYVLPGVNPDTGLPNEVVISSGDAYFNLYSNGPSSFGIFDGSTLRLQEVALTYRFSQQQLAQSPFGSLSIALVGENLYYNAINIPKGLNIDTNTIGTGVNSNGAGIETSIGPSGKRYGVSIKASF